MIKYIRVNIMKGKTIENLIIIVILKYILDRLEDDLREFTGYKKY
jgi:hypothetical protein